MSDRPRYPRRTQRAAMLAGWLATAALLCALPVSSQTTAPTKTEPAPGNFASAAYDVVSIKPNKQGPGNRLINNSLNTWSGTNFSLADLLQFAYDLKPGMLFGEPAWANSEHFDVEAKIVDTGPADLKKLPWGDRQRMLAAVLADRFHLRVHREIRMLPVYDLVVAKGGTKLKETVADSPRSPRDGLRINLSSFHGQFQSHNESVAMLVSNLPFWVNRTVLDKTGLTAYYDIQLNWTPDDAPAGEDTIAPPLFAALEEQLGLKLVSTKAPVQVLVVDHAEMPTAN